jgi:hypothetical protein
MSTMIADLQDMELAEYLAKHLSDYEFEMLVRCRIKRVFDGVYVRHPSMSDSHFSCRYEHAWGDEGAWRVCVGATYKDTVSMSGQVLSITLADAERQWYAQVENKLSLLLPAPKE